MKELKTLIQQGKLTDGIQYLGEKLKADPLNIDYRSSFIELLCIDGQIERADKQLDMLVRQHPECLGGASSLRQLIRAAQARVDFANGGDTVTLTSEADDSFKALVGLRIAMKEQNAEAITTHAEQLESLRSEVQLGINDVLETTVRDLDDTLCNYVEVFGTNGLYYLFPLSQIESIAFKPVSSLVESVWRRVEIEVKDGPGGDAFIPMTYLGSESDQEKLGQETNWAQLEGSEVYVGRGLKVWLVGEADLALNACATVKLHENVRCEAVSV
ncbi:type VI secretion system accessory protein TagJ [Corallincola spongiicola]|uniref:Protein of avirulence locus ImpE n=1 Tax=Corallincola spongiicola TaxID=2520508 RepID=A0ABY1WTN6_9GAMM|nr:type VI secretion system accessory protein TagJ [Corallincola spongiicola]TAA48087.1 protein of avirulence locus ImpE [Corallincola spongiicola]